MKATRAIALSFALIGLVACAESDVTPPQDGHWSGVLADVRVQWSAAEGIDLTTGPAVAVRAYLESYNLVQLSGSFAKAYDGFESAVPENEPPDDVANPAAFDRRPTTDVPVSAPLSGNIKFRVQSESVAPDTANVVVCSFTYGLGEKQGDGQYESVATGGPLDSRGIAGIRLDLEPPADAPPIEQPQAGAALSPASNVFGGWKIVGRLDSKSAGQEWPEAEAVQRACIAEAPDPLPIRNNLLQGPRPLEGNFEGNSPAPGWPEAPSNK